MLKSQDPLNETLFKEKEMTLCEEYFVKEGLPENYTVSC